MVRVLLAVAHSTLRAALEECLIPEEDVSCGTAATAEELWDRLSRVPWDVIILDLRLPEQTKVESVQRLHATYPNLPILVISLSLGVPLHRWQEAGARGFVAKANLSTELIEAVRVLGRGGNYFPEASG
jgi:two-component system, NarL family, response regulator EvgA